LVEFFGFVSKCQSCIKPDLCSNQVSILCILGHHGAIEIGIIIIIINILVWCHDDQLEIRAEIGLGKKEINHSKKEKKETKKDDRLCTSFCELQGNQPAEKETELVLASDVVDISYQCTTEIFSIQTEKNTH